MAGKIVQGCFNLIVMCILYSTQMIGRNCLYPLNHAETLPLPGLRRIKTGGKMVSAGTHP